MFSLIASKIYKARLGICRPPLNHLDTTLKTAIEMTFSATTSEDLSLDDELIRIELLRSVVSFFW